MHKNLHPPTNVSFSGARSIVLLLFLTVLSFSAFGQTPGIIYKPATSSGAKVLDPNADGYVSISKAGFSGTNDEGSGISEIPYRPFPALTTEPIADLNTGSSGGHTDLATPTAGNAFTGSPIAGFFNGTELLFRIRLGSSSTASKGYSVLIDTDQKFDGTGTNPGFEYEVLLASNFAVQVIRHTPTGISTIFTGSIDQYSQRSVAASTSGGNADYFYDFYVPLSAFGGGINASTPLRMSGITITSAQSGITGTVSDVGGVNFQAYNYDAPAAWRALINAFPATSLSTLQTSAFPKVAAQAPVVSGPILANSTSISGTSTEASESVITVFRSVGGGTPTSIGTTTVNANGTWTLPGLSSTLLAAGNVITATVTANGKSVSPASAPVSVTTGICLSTPAPIITGLNGSGQSRGFTGTTTFIGAQRIRVYATNAPTVVVQTVDVTTTATGATWSTVAQNLADNSFFATTTPLTSGAISGCESLRSNQLCYRNGQPAINTQTVQITSVDYNTGTYNSATSPTTWNEVPTNITKISGTLNLGGTNIAGNIVIFKNATPTTLSVAFGTNTATTTWEILVPETFRNSLQPGDVLNVRTDITLNGGGQTTCANSYSSRSNFLFVQATTAAPTINSPKCGLVTTLTGTSSEAAGTELQFYKDGTAGNRNGTLVVQNGTTTPITATVTSTGAWEANFSSATGGGIPAGTAITARAKASGKVRSVNSNVVASTPGPSGVLTVTAPIIEGATSVSGTGPTSTAGAKVTLYIDGTPFPTSVQIASDGKWTVSGIASQELFAGASVSATFTPIDGCESIKSAAVVVSCSAPNITFTLSASPNTICGGTTTSVTLSGSEYGISYRLLVNGVESGSSVLGTGSPITLTTGVLTNTTTANITRTVTYRARKVSGTTCEAVSSNTTSITVRPQPITTGLSFSSTTQTTCANGTTSFSLSGTNINYNYQLVNEATGSLVGSAVQGVSSGAITLGTGTITANSTFSLRITVRPAGTEACSLTLPGQVSVNITSPSTTRAVFAENSKACVGGATNISVSTEPNSDFLYRVYRRVGTSQNPATDPMIGSFTGNGSIRSVSTGQLNNAGVQNYYVTVARQTGNTCGTLTLTNTTQVEVTNSPIPANAGADIITCASSVVLQGNDVAPGIGTWSRVSGPTEVTFSSVNNRNATVQGLSSGSYVFRWQVQATCGSTSSPSQDEVTVVVNCDAIYTLAVPKYKDQYTTGDVLATAQDPDGAVSSAMLLQGTIPRGATLSGTSGAISIVSPSQLIEGTYPVSIRLVDQFGVATVSDIVLRIYGNSPEVVPLPVELVYFRAALQQKQVLLKWLTASEENNKEFVVERSADGKSFSAIGTVAGAGTTTQAQQYSFIDNEPISGTTYYRLKQVDFDGEFAYSNIVFIQANGTTSQEQNLAVWPNPFDQQVTAEIFSKTAAEAIVELSDMQGQQVYRGTVQLKPGFNTLELPFKGLSSGMYILRLRGGDINESAKVIKK